MDRRDHAVRERVPHLNRAPERRGQDGRVGHGVAGGADRAHRRRVLPAHGAAVGPHDGGGPVAGQAGGAGLGALHGQAPSERTG